MKLIERLKQQRAHKRWYIHEYERFRRLYMESNDRMDAAEREVATLRLALDLSTRPDDRPLWRRIANQRRALSDANHAIDLWQRLYYHADQSTDEQEAAMRRHMHELAIRNTALNRAMRAVWMESVAGDTVWRTEWLRDTMCEAGFEGVWIADGELELQAVSSDSQPTR